jgi:hypothetical protein
VAVFDYDNDGCLTFFSSCLPDDWGKMPHNRVTFSITTLGGLKFEMSRRNQAFATLLGTGRLRRRY